MPAISYSEAVHFGQPAIWQGTRIVVKVRMLQAARSLVVENEDECLIKQPGLAQFNRSRGRPGSVDFHDVLGVSIFSNKKLLSLRKQLQGLGLAGLLAYGLTNTAYYTAVFLFIWVYALKTPTGLGHQIAAKRLVEVLAMTWAGSQVTKLPRAMGAVLLAPTVANILNELKAALRLRSIQQAYFLIVGACLIIALAVFGTVLVLYS